LLPVENTPFQSVANCHRLSLNLEQFQYPNNAICDDYRFVQLVLPNTHNLPSIPAQLATHSSVSFPVVGDFSIPKLLIAARAFVALWATVPETPIHKNDNALAPKSKIRLAKQRLVASPARDMELPKYFNQPQLCRFVSARADQ
jgi:hypothetical protein